MNRKRIGKQDMRRAALLLCRMQLLFIVSLGWWGFLYPDLTVKSGVIQQVEETEAPPAGEVEKKGAPQASPAQIYYEMLEAEPGEITIRSGLLEAILKNKRK